MYKGGFLKIMYCQIAKEKHKSPSTYLYLSKHLQNKNNQKTSTLTTATKTIPACIVFPFCVRTCTGGRDAISRPLLRFLRGRFIHFRRGSSCHNFRLTLWRCWSGNANLWGWLRLSHHVLLLLLLWWWWLWLWSVVLGLWHWG